MNMQAVPTGLPELYAFNIEGGGYVIASADDRTLPVLGYSQTGSFDVNQIPDNMRTWLQGYAEQIRMLGDADAPFYDLQGRRVSHPHKGIYIQNGRRVVIK